MTAQVADPAKIFMLLKPVMIAFLTAISRFSFYFCKVFFYRPDLF
jgi:hypothetical protein